MGCSSDASVGSYSRAHPPPIWQAGSVWCVPLNECGDQIPTSEFRGGFQLKCFKRELALLVLCLLPAGFPGLLIPFRSAAFPSPLRLVPFRHQPSPPRTRKTMSDSQVQPWSTNPNAPKIPYHLYTLEKAFFAGVLIASLLYGTTKIPRLPIRLSALTLFWLVLGMLVVLFFKCIAALLNPVYRKRDGIKWGLVSYTVAMFSFVTVYTAVKLHILSISFIDNREFANGTPVGPYGYQVTTRSTLLGTTPNIVCVLNNLLAEGLLVGSWFDDAPADSVV